MVPVQDRRVIKCICRFLQRSFYRGFFFRPLWFLAIDSNKLETDSPFQGIPGKSLLQLMQCVRKMR